MAAPPTEGYIPPKFDPSKGLLIKQFEEQAMKAPDRIALVTDAQTVTLGEMNSQANAIAGRIIEIGVPTGQVVALHMAHGIEKIIAAIGVLKAGAAYASIDPVHKDRDIRNLLEHTQTQTVLTDQGNEERARRLALVDITVINVTTIVSSPIVQNINRPVSPHSPSFVIYTSGSTGSPKGVLSLHGHDFETVMITITERKLASTDRIAFPHGFWFTTLMAGLLVGATVHPFDFRDVGLGAMRDWLLGHHITYYGGILTGFRQLLTSLKAEDYFPDMRCVSVAGEPLQRDDLERFDRHFPPGCELTTAYASTEQVLITKFTADRKAMPKGADTVPIGYPYLGVDVRLVDSTLQSVPPGKVGEIIVGGDNLCGGYWRNSELTEKVFPPDPVNPGQRVYRTGDLAVMDTDGCLHGRGRADQQVKIRGHRVLTSEIENILIEHPAIKAAVVVLDQVNFGGNKLIGYVVGETNTIPTTSELRAYLGRRLPDHMLPSVFMPVSGFALTVTGKVDRSALPLPTIDIRDRAGDPVPPENSVEETMRAIWQDLLGIDGISVEDDFFLIGGDSVMALTMFLQLEEQLGRQLPFESLWLQGSTIRALAGAVTGDAPAPHWDQALPLQTNGEKPLLFVVSMVSMPVYCLQLIRHLGGDQPVYGLPAKGIGGDTQPDRRVEDMAAHCIAMMRRVQPTGPYRIMGHSAAGLVAFEVAQALRAAGESVAKLVLLDSDMPGTTGHLAGKVARQPLKSARMASSLLGQSIRRATPDASADLKAARTSAYFRYRPKPYAGDAILITSAERQQRADLIADWRRLVTGALTADQAPGDHNSMLMEPAVAELSAILKRHL